MPRVYKPSKNDVKLQEVLTQLYILRTAIKTEKENSLEERISKISLLVKEVKDSLSSIQE